MNWRECISSRSVCSISSPSRGSIPEALRIEKEVSQGSKGKGKGGSHAELLLLSLSWPSPCGRGSLRPTTEGRVSEEANEWLRKLEEEELAEAGARSDGERASDAIHLQGRLHRLTFDTDPV